MLPNLLQQKPRKQSFYLKKEELSGWNNQNSPTDENECFFQTEETNLKNQECDSPKNIVSKNKLQVKDSYQEKLPLRRKVLKEINNNVPYSKRLMTEAFQEDPAEEKQWFPPSTEFVSSESCFVMKQNKKRSRSVCESYKHQIKDGDRIEGIPSISDSENIHQNQKIVSELKQIKEFLSSPHRYDTFQGIDRRVESEQFCSEQIFVKKKVSFENISHKNIYISQQDNNANITKYQPRSTFLNKTQLGDKKAAEIIDIVKRKEKSFSVYQQDIKTGKKEGYLNEINKELIECNHIDLKCRKESRGAVAGGGGAGQQFIFKSLLPKIYANRFVSNYKSREGYSRLSESRNNLNQTNQTEPYCKHHIEEEENKKLQSIEDTKDKKNIDLSSCIEVKYLPKKRSSCNSITKLKSSEQEKGLAVLPQKYFSLGEWLKEYELKAEKMDPQQDKVVTTRKENHFGKQSSTQGYSQENKSMQEYIKYLKQSKEKSRAASPKGKDTKIHLKTENISLIRSKSRRLQDKNYTQYSSHFNNTQNASFHCQKVTVGQMSKILKRDSLEQEDSVSIPIQLKDLIQTHQEQQFQEAVS